MAASETAVGAVRQQQDIVGDEGKVGGRKKRELRRRREESPRSCRRDRRFGPRTFPSPSSMGGTSSYFARLPWGEREEKHEGDVRSSTISERSSARKLRQSNGSQ